MYDILGNLYKETGNTLTDSEGFEYPEMEIISGWHVNILRQDMTEDLEPFVVEVSSTPRRVFGGNEANTVFLRFEDEAEFIEVTGYGQDDEGEIE